ncbi:hypothetical protein GCM10011502_30270 [Oceanisphaera marina]|uniref:HTH OST-type domain-containing protein n=1 Tax=Oceanisphaera marina TaxID=2017550 RepID=A0ABQ1J1U7_9GAMM|nr:hypothetical protein [Oceanisphaera marina]GGB55275.1 hypothetical protein GCM10011502_30270 [Oceanisphaera marina]
MESIDELVYKLAAIIDENAEGNGFVRTFKVDVVEKEWNKLNSGVCFKKVLTKLISRNQVGIVGKNTCEIRDIDRTD